MAKVRFELNIDEIIEAPINVSGNDPIFKNPEATGKTFLFVDKMEGHMQAVYCSHASTDEKQYAQVNYFPIPANALIIDENVDEDAAHKELMSHIQDCCDKVCRTIQTYADIADSKHSVILQGLSPVLEKIEEGGTGNGISEKTLLEALKIVSKQTEKTE